MGFAVHHHASHSHSAQGSVLKGLDLPYWGLLGAQETECRSYRVVGMEAPCVEREIPALSSHSLRLSLVLRPRMAHRSLSDAALCLLGRQVRQTVICHGLQCTSLGRAGREERCTAPRILPPVSTQAWASARGGIQEWLDQGAELVSAGVRMFHQPAGLPPL